MKNANSSEEWDKLWKTEGKASWRGDAMREVYERIDQLIPAKAFVLDIGGGVGILADYLKRESEPGKTQRERRVEVWDISPEAIKQAEASGHYGRIVDLEKFCPPIPVGAWVVATEVLEHLSEPARHRVLDRIKAAGGKAFLSVPNDRLGPEEEPQHTIQWSAMAFKQYLKAFKPRLEVLGPKASPHNDPAFLLAVCGAPTKSFTMSLTLPVRDEGKDLGRVLASFRGAADEIVVGIDPRTVDNTREVALRYADKVFDIVDPEGPLPGKYYSPRCQVMAKSGEARVPEGGVHFAWVRNQCLDACTGDWIFMTEGHEHLAEGTDILLNLDQVPEAAKIAMVWRSNGHNQRWGFPWVHRNFDTKILYERGTHNSLKFPDSYMVVKLPQVRTLHERDHDRTVQRAAQRKVQNRIHLMDDWMTRGSEYSKYYLASEWRSFDNARSERHFRELLNMNSRNGAMRYQARLILAKLLAFRARDAELKVKALRELHEDMFWRATISLRNETQIKTFDALVEAGHVAIMDPILARVGPDHRVYQLTASADKVLMICEDSTLEAKEAKEEARNVLLGCATEDWSRTEHWIWLGDMAAEAESWEEAVQFYQYGASRIGNPPFTCWWIDTSFYSYLPAQRLAMAFAECGNRESSLQWALVVRDQLPPEDKELRDEAEAIIRVLEGTEDHE